MSFFFCKQKTAYGMRISDWSSDVCSSYLGDGGECIDPACGLEPALHPHIGLVEPRPDEAVDGVARLVVRPFLVHVLVDARQHTQHLTAARIETHIGADRVHHVDARSLRQLPRPRLERSEEHTSELQSLMRISYAVFCLQKKKT